LAPLQLWNKQNTGRVLSRTDAIQPEHSVNYSYDSLYRLGQVVSQDSSWGISWTFDIWGNRLTQTPQGLATGKVGTQTLGYNNNRVTTNTYDAAGNQTNDGLHNYTFNAENQMTQMDGGTAVYAYDGEGRRMKKTVGSETTYYFYGVGGLLCEFTTTNIGATQASSTNRTTYRTSDKLGTAILLLIAASGTAVENNRTLPYGESWLTDVNSANDKKFTTYQRDAESGLDHAMNRYNSSTNGRFLSADRGGGKLWMPQTLNRFGYAMNDPINNADADGNIPKGQCPYAQDDPCTPPPISIGSMTISGWHDAFAWQKAEIREQKQSYDLARRYLQKSIEMLKMKSYSSACENTLAALGTNSAELVGRIDRTAIIDAATSNIKYTSTMTLIGGIVNRLVGENRTIAQVLRMNL